MTAEVVFFIIATIVSLLSQDTGWIIAYSLILIADAIVEKRQMKGERE